MKTKYLSKYSVFVNAPDDKLDWIIRFVRDWYDSGTDELLPVKACQFSLDSDYNYTVYASGADFGRVVAEVPTIKEAQELIERKEVERE